MNQRLRKAFKQLADLGAILFYIAAICLFVLWANYPHKQKAAPLPLVTAAPALNGNSAADQAAERIAPSLIEFTNNQASLRDMVVIITGSDNSSRIMTLTRTDAPPHVLYRMGLALLEQGADNLVPPPTQTKKEEHAL